MPAGAYGREAGLRAFRGMVERSRYVEELGFDWVSISGDGALLARGTGVGQCQKRKAWVRQGTEVDRAVRAAPKLRLRRRRYPPVGLGETLPKRSNTLGDGLGSEPAGTHTLPSHPCTPWRKSLDDFTRVAIYDFRAFSRSRGRASYPLRLI